MNQGAAAGRIEFQRLDKSPPRKLTCGECSAANKAAQAAKRAAEQRASTDDHALPRTPSTTWKSARRDCSKGPYPLASLLLRAPHVPHNAAVVFDAVAFITSRRW